MSISRRSVANMSKPSGVTTQINKKNFADLFHNEVTAWLVLALSVVITALGWWLSSEAIEKRANDRFSFEVRDAQERIQSRIQQYQQLLHGASRSLMRTPWSIVITGACMWRR